MKESHSNFRNFYKTKDCTQPVTKISTGKQSVHVMFDETVYKGVKLLFKDLRYETCIHLSTDF